MNETCGSYRYFRRKEIGKPIGTCHANPPQLVLTGMAEHPITRQAIPMTHSFWPILGDTEFCGLHTVRTAADNIAAIDLSKLEPDQLAGEG